MVDKASMSLRNEFASVRIGIRSERNRAQLEIRNTETDEAIRLDPLELEALTRMRHADFGPLILM